MIYVIQLILSFFYVVPFVSLLWKPTLKQTVDVIKIVLAIATTKAILYLIFGFSLVGFLASLTAIVFAITVLILNSKGLIHP